MTTWSIWLRKRSNGKIWLIKQFNLANFRTSLSPKSQMTIKRRSLKGTSIEKLRICLIAPRCSMYIKSRLSWKENRRPRDNWRSSLRMMMKSKRNSYKNIQNKTMKSLQREQNWNQSNRSLHKKSSKSQMIIKLFSNLLKTSLIISLREWEPLRMSSHQRSRFLKRKARNTWIWSIKISHSWKTLKILLNQSSRFQSRLLRMKSSQRWKRLISNPRRKL